jgi:hypothetical protein
MLQPMTARLLADTLLVLHGLFIVFVLFGALPLSCRALAGWLPLLHLPAVAWAVYVAAAGRICPLTPIENTLRRAAGQAGYDGGFIEHYLLAAIYPNGLTRGVQIGLGVFVLALNVALYARWFARRRRASDHPLGH